MNTSTTNLLKKYKDDFLIYLFETKEYTKNTVKTYDIALEQMLEFGEFESENDKIIFNLYRYRNRLKKQSSSTISKKLSIIHSFREYLINGGFNVEIIGDESVKVVKKSFTPINSDIILSALTFASLEEKLIIYLIYEYGLRISEIANLKIEDFEEYSFRVLKGKNFKNYPIEKHFFDIFREFLHENSKNSYLFEKNGKKLSENILRYNLTKAFSKIDAKVTPQQLRYSLVVDLLNAGADISDIVNLLGHKSYSLVLPKKDLNKSQKINKYKNLHPMCKDDNGIS